jgi:hypothetical protein
MDFDKIPTPAGDDAKSAGMESREKNEVAPSVEDLKKKRADLEARVALAKQAKEADITKKLGEREQLVAEDTRLVPLIEETQGTLDYFEAQEEQGLLTDPADKAELDNLKKLSASLEEQRTEGARKYEAIMSEPDIYGKVWEEAHKEDKDRMAQGEAEKRKAEFEATCAEVMKELDAKSDAFILRLKTFQKDFAECIDDTNNKTGSERNAAFSELGEIIKKAQENLKAGQSETFNELGSFRWGDPIAYLTALEEYRAKLGLFQGREKAAIDYVIKANRAKFEAAGEIDQRYAKLRSKWDEMDGAGTNELGREYAGILDEASAKDKELSMRPGDDFRSKISYKFHKQLTENREVSYLYSHMRDRAGKY